MARRPPQIAVAAARRARERDGLNRPRSVLVVLVSSLLVLWFAAARPAAAQEAEDSQATESSSTETAPVGYDASSDPNDSTDPEGDDPLDDPDAVKDEEDPEEEVDDPDDDPDDHEQTGVIVTGPDDHEQTGVIVTGPDAGTGTGTGTTGTAHPVPGGADSGSGGTNTVIRRESNAAPPVVLGARTSAPLPFTGTENVPWLTAMGLGLIGSGAWITRLARRRPED